MTGPDTQTPPVAAGHAKPRALRFGLVSTVAWLVFGLAHLAAGHPRAATVHLVAALSTACALIWIRRGSDARATVGSHLVFVITTTALLSDQRISGGLDSAGQAWLVLLPLAASYLVTRAAGMVWLAIVLVALFGQAVASVWFPISPEYIEQGLGRVPSLVGLLFATFAMGLAARQSFDDQVEELEAARARTAAVGALKQALLANTSHELRTPVHGMLGALTLVQRGQLDARQRELLDTAAASGEHLASLLDDILDYASLEAGMIDIERAPVDVVSAAEDALDVVANAAAEKGVEVALLVEGAIPPMVTDARRLRQILLNVVGNAVKFTDRGEVALRLSSRVVEGGLDELVAEISDTGPGIAEAHLQRLFTSFERGDPETARQHGGAGLGLALSRRLARALAGDIELRSDVGVGSTFTVRVRGERAPGSPVGSSLRGVDVLVVESHELVRSGIASTLKALGATPRTVATAEAARAAFRDGRLPRALLVGSALSPSDAAAAATSFGAPPDLPVVALISPIMANGVESADDSRAVPALAPCRRSRLGEALERALGLAPSDEESASSSPTARRERLRVLVVDDDPTNRRVARGYLDALGHDSVDAEDGPGGLEQLRAEVAFDVVLLDVHMPEMDGYEVASRARALLGDACPVLVAVSASVDDVSIAKALASGFDSFLGKPLRLKQLGSALKALGRAAPRLRKQRAAQSPADGLLDPATIAQLRELFPDPAELEETLSPFITDARAVASWLGDCASVPDVELRSRVHRLRGAAGTAGARRLMLLAAAVEEQLVDGRPNEARRAVAPLIAAIEPSLEALEGLLADAFAAPAFDLEGRLARIPADGSCRGILLLSILGQLPQGVSAAQAFEAAGLQPRTVHALRWYSYRDMVRLCASVARLAHPDDSLPDAMGKITRGYYATMAHSLVGRMIFGVLGRDIEQVFLVGPRGWQLCVSFGRFELERRGPRGGVYRFRGYPCLTEIIDVGVVHGALDHCGVGERTVRVEPHADGADIHISW